MAATGQPQALLPSQGPARSKYSRGVCTECTRRHHKCDAVHPECTPCKVACLTCAWPEKKGRPMQGRVGALEAKVDAQQAEIESLKATVAALVQATGIGAQSPLRVHPGQHQQLDSLVIPLTPVSSAPSSSFPSSAESSPHPAMHALPAQHGALLGVPPADHAFARGPAGMSSSSDRSFQYDGGGVHLDIPRRHARTLSNASSSSDSSFQYDAYTSGGSQASSPCIPALLFDPASGWPLPDPAGFDSLGAPSAPGYTDVPLALNVIEAGTEPGRSSDVFNSNMWGGASGADGVGLGLGMEGNTWGKVTEDTTMGEVTMDG